MAGDTCGVVGVQTDPLQRHEVLERGASRRPVNPSRPFIDPISAQRRRVIARSDGHRSDLGQSIQAERLQRLQLDDSGKIPDSTYLIDGKVPQLSAASDE